MRKLFSIVLVLLVCFCTVFAGCGTPGGPKSAEKHVSNTVWKHDEDTHWQECGGCGIFVDVNNYYSQKTFVQNLTKKDYLPLRADTPDKYAQEFGFETFADYLEVYDQGKAPHLFMTTGPNAGKCICGATKGA